MFITSAAKKVQQVVDWHYYVYSFLASVLAVCLAIQANILTLPPSLTGAQFYVAVAVIFLTAFLPRLQTQTGPGADPIVSPPAPADDPNPKAP